MLYVGEQDFYVPRDMDGRFKRYASPMESFADTLGVMKGLVPSHIVFNGKVGALTGKNALKARVGKTVLVVSQANRDTRPHLIGGHGDRLGQRQFATRRNRTWRPGSSRVARRRALYTFRQPGAPTSTTT